jgi:hypothetical protein
MTTAAASAALVVIVDSFMFVHSFLNLKLHREWPLWLEAEATGN